MTQKISSRRSESGPLVLLATTLGAGGTETYAIVLACGYRRRGIDTRVLVDHLPDERAAILDDAGVPYEVLDPDRKLSNAAYCQALSHALQACNARLLHCHTWERNYENFHAAKALGIPVVYTLHTTVLNTLRYRFAALKRPHTFVDQWKAFREKPAVINISDRSEANFRALYPRIKATQRIYCGTWIPEHVVDAGAGGTAPRVLWAGSLIPRKNPLLALQIWSKVAARHPGAHLTIAGDGPLMPDVRRAAELCPPGSVTLSGFLTDMTAELEKSEIMFHTASQEGTPRNIAYALAYGFPTVALNVGAIDEMVLDGRTGALAGRDRPDDLAAHLLRLMANPELRRAMGREARKHAEAHFNLDNHIDDNLAAYARLCGIVVDYVRPDVSYRPLSLI